MAKKSPNKTAAIRDALESSTSGSPTEIAKQLNRQGIRVTSAYVSTIKAMEKKKAKSGASRRQPGRPSKTRGKTLGVGSAVHDLMQTSDLVLQAVDLVVKVGAKEAKQLVGMAEQMVTRIRGEE